MILYRQTTILRPHSCRLIIDYIWLYIHRLYWPTFLLVRQPKEIKRTPRHEASAWIRHVGVTVSGVPTVAGALFAVWQCVGGLRFPSGQLSDLWTGLSNKLWGERHQHSGCGHWLLECLDKPHPVEGCQASFFQWSGLFEEFKLMPRSRTIILGYMKYARILLFYSYSHVLHLDWCILGQWV